LEPALLGHGVFFPAQLIARLDKRCKENDFGPEIFRASPPVTSKKGRLKKGKLSTLLSAAAVVNLLKLRMTLKVFPAIIIEVSATCFAYDWNWRRV